jgi:hypothetical protein
MPGVAFGENNHQSAGMRFFSQLTEISHNPIKIVGLEINANLLNYYF